MANGVDPLQKIQIPFFGSVYYAVRHIFDLIPLFVFMCSLDKIQIRVGLSYKACAWSVLVNPLCDIQVAAYSIRLERMRWDFPLRLQPFQGLDGIVFHSINEMRSQMTVKNPNWVNSHHE